MTQATMTMSTTSRRSCSGGRAGEEAAQELEHGAYLLRRGPQRATALRSRSTWRAARRRRRGPGGSRPRRGRGPGRPRARRRRSPPPRLPPRRWPGGAGGSSPAARVTNDLRLGPTSTGKPSAHELVEAGAELERVTRVLEEAEAGIEHQALAREAGGERALGCSRTTRAPRRPPRPRRRRRRRRRSPASPPWRRGCA